MKKILGLALFLCLSVTPAFALNSAQGWCERGAVKPIVSGLTSVTNVQASYPQCTVTVYVHGTVTLATIYSDNSTPPTPIPSGSFVANSLGYWKFYVANGNYDITLSGAGFPSPFTVNDVAVGSTTLDCSTYPGANAGNKISNCISGLPLTGGVADARNIQGSQTISIDIFGGVTKPVTLLLGVGTYTITTGMSVPVATADTNGGVCGSIVGAGTRLTKFLWTGTGSLFSTSVGTRGTGCVFRDFTVDMESNSNSGVSAFNFADGIGNSIFENILMFGNANTGYGIKCSTVTSSNLCSNNTFLHVDTYSNGSADWAGPAFWMNGTDTSGKRANANRFISDNPEYALIGFEINGGGNVIEGATFGVSGASAIGVQFDGASSGNSGNAGNVIISSYFDSSLAIAIKCNIAAISLPICATVYDSVGFVQPAGGGSTDSGTAGAPRIQVYGDEDSGRTFNGELYVNWGYPNTASSAGQNIFGSQDWINTDRWTWSTRNYAIAASGAVRASNVVTITTTSPTNYYTGQSVYVEGVTNSSFNGGPFTITVANQNTFTYSQVAADATSGSGNVVNVGLLDFYNRSITDGRTVHWDFESDTTGAGAAAGNSFGEFAFVYDTHANATRAGHFEWKSQQAGALLTRMSLGNGLQVYNAGSAPSGGDLGAGTVNIATTNGYNVNGVPIILSGTTASIGGGALSAGQCTSGSVSITGATAAMTAVVQPNTYPGDGVYWKAQSIGGGTVNVYICVSVNATPTASTYNVRVIQ